MITCDPAEATKTLNLMLNHHMSLECTKPFRVCSVSWIAKPEYIRGTGKTIEEAVENCHRNILKERNK